MIVEKDVSSDHQLRLKILVKFILRRLAYEMNY